MLNPAETKLVACLWHAFDQWRIPDWVIEAVRSRFPEMKLVHLPDYQGLEGEIADADIFVGWSLKPEQFVLARRLGWIHCLGAGVNQLIREDIVRSPVRITNSSRVHTLTIAEHTLGFLLALARRFPSAFRTQQRKQWAQQEIWNEEPHPLEISGRTLLIVGYGAIGKEVARRARAFGMRVIGIKRDPTNGTEYADQVVAHDKLMEVLPDADFVVLSAPVTRETERLFGQAQFAAMKRTAYFINVGRGALLVPGALVEALEKGSIAGAAIDVAGVEPLPPDSLLWTAPHLFLTPHLSGVSERLWHRHLDLWLENLERYFAGRPLLNLVDKQRGY